MLLSTTLCLTVLLTIPAPSPESGHAPLYMTRDLPVLTEHLGLPQDDDVVAVLSQLLEDYDTQFTQLSQSVQSRSTRAYQTLQGDSLGLALQQTQESFRLDHDQLARVLEQNVAAVLDEAHRSRWQSARRLLTRQRLIPRGQFSAERVDVADLYRTTFPDTQFEATAEVDEVLEQWTLRVDEALVARMPWDRIGVNEILHFVGSGQVDRAAELLQQQYDHNAQVRDINLATIAAIEGLLPLDAATTWSSASLTAAFPGIYRHDLIDVLIELLIELLIADEVDQAMERDAARVVELLQDLHNDYAQQRSPLRNTLKNLQLKIEGIKAIEQLTKRGTSQQQDQEIRFKTQSKLNTLSNTFEARIATLVGLERYLIARDAIAVDLPEIKIGPIPAALLGDGPRGELPTIPTRNGPNAGVAPEDAVAISPNQNMPPHDPNDAGPRTDAPAADPDDQGPRGGAPDPDPPESGSPSGQ